MDDDMTNVQKTINKTRDEVAERLDSLSFQSAKDSLDNATKQARENLQNASETVRTVGGSASKAASQAMRDGVDHAQRINEGVSKQAASRLEEYSEFVREHPISATAGALLIGYVLARWIR